MRIKIREIKQQNKWIGQEVAVKGWVRTVRSQKNFTFIEVNDGSTLSNLQVIVPQELPQYAATIVSTYHRSLSCDSGEGCGESWCKTDGRNPCR